MLFRFNGAYYTWFVTFETYACCIKMNGHNFNVNKQNMLYKYQQLKDNRSSMSAYIFLNIQW